MNDPEVTINDALPNGNLVATEMAIEATVESIRLVKRIPAPLKIIADQVIRSAASVAANLTEGQGRSGRGRIHYWRIAFASAKEFDCHLRMLLGAGAVDRARAVIPLRLFDEVVGAMTWGLLHPRS